MNFLGVDVGSTNIKCQVMDEKGVVLFEHSNHFDMLQIGLYEYVDIVNIYDAFETMVMEATRKFQIDSICISSFGESFVLLDHNDQILVHPMIYTDSRGHEELNEIITDYSKAEIFSITGSMPQGFFSLYRLLWIRKHMSNEYKRARKFMQIADYFNYRLTDRHVTDYSLAARSGLFDVNIKQFSKSMTDRLSISFSLFPKPLKTGEIIGKVSSSFAKRCGIKPSCQVVIGGHDQVMTAIGAGVTESHMGIDGMGTVECITAIYDQKSENLEMGGFGYTQVPFFDKFCTYLLNFTGGSVIEWAQKNIFQNQLSKQQMEEKTILETSSGPSDVLTLPYFMGAATPRQDHDIRGSLIHISLNTKSTDLYKSLLEGLTYEMRYNLETVDRFSIHLDKIIVSGGGSASWLWLHIKANVFNQAIYPLKSKEGGITGAVMLQAVALKKVKDLNEAALQFVRYKEPIKPQPELVLAYEKKYQKYRELYDAVKKFSQ